MKGSDYRIKLKEILNNKGSVKTIEVLAIIAVTAVIASAFLPKLNIAFEKRNEIITNNFKSTDTLITE